MTEETRDPDDPGGTDESGRPESLPEPRDAGDAGSAAGEPAAGEPDPERDDDEVDPLATAEDALDPELLALAAETPSPRWHRAAVMVVVCVLIVVMMVWFSGDIAYFFASSDTMRLGDAHDVTFRDEWENSHVSLEGIPLAPRNENPAPHCGQSQGFPTYQRRFLCRGHQSAIPVMGRPEHDLIIQRYMVRQLRIHYTPPADRPEAAVRDEVMAAARRVRSVHEVRPAEQGELGRVIVDVEGVSGRTDMSAVSKSIQYEVESSVARVERVRVEHVRREVPGSYTGRLVRLGRLGSRFAAVAEYLNECTNYPVTDDTWVLLDGSEAGDGVLDSVGLCYGHEPRQYWPYLALYVLLGGILVLNVVLLFRFFRAARSRR
jgi:hypothetical protein